MRHDKKAGHGSATLTNGGSLPSSVGVGSRVVSDWAIYGAYGYSGELAARRAVELGHRPLLLGRNADRLGAVAGELGLSHRALSLDDQEGLQEALGGVAAILHCAGPFSQTWRQMVDACIATGTHYLDITGEIGVIEAIARRAEDALTRDIVLMPAVGFDVVPSDCLAVHVANRLPSATKLLVAFDANTAPSHGTATSALRMGGGAAVRKMGQLERAPIASKQTTIDFGFDRGEATVSLIPWGDLSTAFRSTGIENIETYSAIAPNALRALKLARYIGFLFRLPVLERSAVRNLTGGVSGPSESQREGKAGWLYAEVGDDHGGRAAARLRVPHPYTVTAWTSVEATARVAAGAVEPGFRTAAMAFGSDFILEFDGVERQDV